MSDSSTVTARLPRKLVGQLERIAKKARRSRSFVMREAVEAYVGEREAFLAAINRGLADVKAGRVVSHERVKTWIDSWGTDNELPMPKPKRKRARRRAA
ncbi:MAG TPA: CopG family ribbon-helix-helix protein [Vineibacter sp.]|nr:CopG family ribbon-helix-helix protein [Vineibacter sp.]